MAVDRIGREGSGRVGRGRRMAKTEGRQKRMQRDRGAGSPDDRGDVRGS